MMYTFERPCTGLCQLAVCCCVRCCTHCGSHPRISGDSCMCNETAFLQNAGLRDTDVLYANWANDRCVQRCAMPVLRGFAVLRSLTLVGVATACALWRMQSPWITAARRWSSRAAVRCLSMMPSPMPWQVRGRCPNLTPLKWAALRLTLRVDCCP